MYHSLESTTVFITMYTRHNFLELIYIHICMKYHLVYRSIVSSWKPFRIYDISIYQILSVKSKVLSQIDDVQYIHTSVYMVEQ